MEVYCHIENDQIMNDEFIMVKKEFDARPMVGDFVYIRGDFEKIVNSLTKKELISVRLIYNNYVYDNQEFSFDDAIVVKSVSFVENKSTGKMDLHIELGQ